MTSSCFALDRFVSARPWSSRRRRQSWARSTPSLRSRCQNGSRTGCITTKPPGQDSIQIFFLCSTRVPLARTRWVWLPFSSLCPLYSKQRRQLIPVKSNKSRGNCFGMLGIKPGDTGWEAIMLPLSYAAPPQKKIYFFETNNQCFIKVIWLLTD